ncbi:MAG: hypothetical protein DHS20C14_02370 [Phycisphaeraceae bacterium]|nr:MAG: hypothetical protein DHS20C14_02370 [Phycisphaeraceae bacterium]
MTGAINNLAASAAGAPLTSAQANKAKKREETQRAQRRARDMFEHQVEQVEHAEGPRRAEDATQEQTREDHQTHGLEYGADGSAKHGPKRKVDLSA